MPKANLSETLFKPSFNTPETSTLISRRDVKKNAAQANWYRDIHKALWAWRGIGPVEVSEVLARIVMSANPRTDNEIFDTVIGYRQGNWIYEWALQGAEWQKKALAISEQDSTLAGQYWLRAAILYSLAGYPHLRNDELAGQVEAFSYRAYSEATALLVGDCHPVEFTVDQNKLTGFLYLPDKEKGPYPTVLLCSNPDTLQQDHYRLFYDYLAPAGFALLSIDSPGVGYSSRWKLSFDTSYLYQQVLTQMVALPWIDSNNIFVLGIKASANAAIRLAYLEPKLLRGAISFAGIVHQGLASGQFVNNLSEMYKDVLASRLGLSAVSDELLRIELATYSLKNQGLLGRRCPTPMLAVAVNNDRLSPIDESKLIASSSEDGQLLTIAASPLKPGLHKAVSEITHWMKKKCI